MTSFANLDKALLTVAPLGIKNVPVTVLSSFKRNEGTRGTVTVYRVAFDDGTVFPYGVSVKNLSRSCS